MTSITTLRTNVWDYINTYLETKESKTISNIDGDATTITVTTSTPHTYSAGNSITISGTTNYNGTYTVASVTNTVTFTITDNTHNVAAETSGTIVAPISTTNIHSAMNDKLVSSEGYPQVIIFPPSCSMEKVSLTGKILQSNISVLIEVYHNSSQNVKALADEITTRLLQGRTYFAGNRLVSMTITEGDNSSWEEGKKKVHRIGFTVEFRYVEDYVW